MRFLTDQDVWLVTVLFLRGLGHDVATASELGYASVPDSEPLVRAKTSERVLVTRDKDFGSLVLFTSGSAGVVFLRITPAIIGAVHAELARMLASRSLAQLAGSFCVVEPGRHRIRPIGG